MEIIGEKLKASREEKGLSLEEVSEDLNIKVEDLNNIELGNKSAFEDIYFLKKSIYDYAKYLGLDYEGLIEEFNEFMFTFTSKIPVDVIDRINKQKEKEEENKAALSPYTMQPKDKTKRSKVIVLIAALVLIVGIVVAIVLLKNNDNSVVMAGLM